tara:strand:+ start:137 stop:349 length:213 start_codon:yes stop_codon:yes gene_type:complete
MQQGNDILETNPVIQNRFEENEDWCEHLEDRVAALEHWAHPKCGIEGFDGYHALVERIEKLEKQVNEITG